MSFSPDLTLFYRDAPLVSHISGAFRGWLDTPDTLAFDNGITAASPQLRYPATVTLAAGDALAIDGVSYTVAAPPRRIGDGLEYLAELV